MLPTYTLESIIQKIDSDLTIPSQATRYRDDEVRIRWLTTMDDLSDPVSEIDKGTSKLLGLLFCHPESEIGRRDLLPRISYYHYRSGKFVDFFCIGYGDQSLSYSYMDSRRVGEMDGSIWRFSDKAFNSVRHDLQQVTKWRYSGESDLILLAARKSKSNNPKLNFTSAISCNLEKMITDKAFNSVPAFFENIFRFAEDYNGNDPVWDFSDRQGWNQGKNFLVNYILSLLPKALAGSYKSARHYAIKDISK